MGEYSGAVHGDSKHAKIYQAGAEIARLQFLG
jgi:hypothetical protein